MPVAILGAGDAILKKIDKKFALQMFTFWREAGNKHIHIGNWINFGP